MTGFFIGLFLGSIVTLVVVSCLFKFCEEDVYWQGYYNGLRKTHEDARKAVEHETDI